MNFTVNRKAFSAVIGRVQGIATPRQTMPILESVLVVASALRPVLHISATDLEVGYATAIDCNGIATPGKALLPAKKLHEVLKAAPTDEVNIELHPDNNRVTVAAGTFVTTLVSLDPAEFPEVVPPLEGDPFQIDAAALLRLIGHVEYCQSTDNTKYNLNGVFLRVEQADDYARLIAAATDGHRLAADSVPLPGDPRPIPVDLQRGIIVPRKGIAELAKIDASGVLCIQIAGNNLSVSTSTETFILRLIDGEFPDFYRIVPKDVKGVAEVARQPLIDAIDRVSLLSTPGKVHPVEMEIGGNRILLRAQNVEMGEASDRVTTATELADDFATRINSPYILQALGAFDGNYVQLHLPEELSPILITPLNETEPFAVIMPMRM